MLSTFIRAAIGGAALLGPARLTAAGAQAPANPACTLLSTAEIQAATGTNYHQGSEGDALGEGAGGGASCQWGGLSLVPGESRPLLSLVVIPPGERGSYTQARLEAKPREGCTRETAPGIGDLAFVESCDKSRGPVAYVRRRSTTSSCRWTPSRPPRPRR
jgi:hypothetical protein